MSEQDKPSESGSIILDAIRRNEGEAGSRVRKSSRRVEGRNPSKDTSGVEKTTSTTKPSYVKEQTEGVKRVEVPVEEPQRSFNFED